MVTTWQIILAIFIVGSSIIMPIYHSYQHRKSLKQQAELLEDTWVKEYINKINVELRNTNDK
jgi:hypothetical protein|tara:strand:+ start:637 stop:822 length:186 start_codon:yes stop_codon:yes gene_type:complete